MSTIQYRAAQCMLMLTISLLLATCATPPAPRAAEQATATVPPATATTIATTTATAAATPIRTSIATPTRPTGTVSRKRLDAYTFLDSNHGWVARGAVIVATEDGGQTWRERGHLPAEVEALRFTSPTEGRASTREGVYQTLDGGATWQPLPEGEWRWPLLTGADVCPEHYHIDSVSAIDAQTGWLLCDDEPAVGFQSKSVYRSDDGGQTWRLIASGRLGQRDDFPLNAGYANGIFFLDAQHGWIARARGWLLHTTDGGQTWSSAGSPAARAGPNLRQPFFLSLQQGFVIAYQFGDPRGNVLFRTDDGGQTWYDIYPPPADTPE